MQIAIIGTGIAGMAAAYLLQRRHQITVFEQNDYVGGHAHTIRVGENGHSVGVDTGFVVFNPERYPNLVRLFDALGVATQATDMSFSVRCRSCDLEYSPQSLRSLFAQRSNLWRPSHYRMVRDALRAHRDARQFLEQSADATTSLREFIATRGYSREFAGHLLVPLAAAIWSAAPGETLDMPARFCLQFLDNHRMLAIRNKPTWRTVCGGSEAYVTKLTAGFRDRIRLRCGIARVRRETDHVELTDVYGQSHRFDAVVIAAHADQSLRMLADPSDAERELLSVFHYSRNHTVLHCDPSVLPMRPAARSAWNYELTHCHTSERPVADRHVALSYDMNRLQRLDAVRQYCVSLNRPQPIADSQVIRRMVYEHPIFSRHTLEAQRRLPSLNGVRRTWYCGAHFGYGFHEDGLASALAVAQSLGITLP